VSVVSSWISGLALGMMDTVCCGAARRSDGAGCNASCV